MEIVIIVRDCEEMGRKRLDIPLGPFKTQRSFFAMPQSITISNDQEFSVGPVTATDANGNPVPLGGPLSFSSSDPTLLTVTDHGDGTAEAVAVKGSGGGNVVLSVTDTVLTDTVDVTVTLAPPPVVETGLVIPLGTPTTQP